MTGLSLSPKSSAAGQADSPRDLRAYIAKGAVYLPDEARFEHLVQLPEGADLGKAINDAMKAVEVNNPGLDGVLLHDYTAISNDVLIELLRILWKLPESIEGDGFGLIYEYFLGKFAFAEGSKGGEFFTPTSIVRLIVEIIQPYHGRILDPACGSGGHVCPVRTLRGAPQEAAHRRAVSVRPGEDR